VEVAGAASVGSTSVITGAGGIRYNFVWEAGGVRDPAVLPAGSRLGNPQQVTSLDAGSTVLYPAMIGCHCPAPSVERCGATWRFPPTKFYGSAFAAVMDAMRCSGSVRIVIGASATVARVAGLKHGCSSTAAPTAGISGVPKAASIIAIANGGIAAGHTHA